MSDRPIITFSYSSEDPDVVVTIGEGLDGIDTRDIAEALFARAGKVTEVRIDFPDGRHWTWPVAR